MNTDKKSKTSYSGTMDSMLEEHKQIIKDLIETYVVNLDENGSPKSSITNTMELIDRAVKLIKD